MDDPKKEVLDMPVTVSGAVESGIPVSDSPEDRVEALRRVHVFSDLPEDQLLWFADNVEERRLAQGDVLFAPGDPPDWMFIFLEGEAHAYPNEKIHDDVYIVRS